MFNTILVVLDTEEDCTSVFEQAMDIAKQMGAGLEVMGDHFLR